MACRSAGNNPRDELRASGRSRGSFGWSVRRIDGHDFHQIVENAREMPFQPGKPSVIIANTVKSKGISFAEGRVEYHYWKPRAMNWKGRIVSLLRRPREDHGNERDERSPHGIR